MLATARPSCYISLVINIVSVHMFSYVQLSGTITYLSVVKKLLTHSLTHALYRGWPNASKM